MDSTHLASCKLPIHLLLAKVKIFLDTDYSRGIFYVTTGVVARAGAIVNRAYPPQYQHTKKGNESMTSEQKSLGELELIILKTVWETPESTVQEVAEIVGERRNCARTTVLTVMQRLHAKGFLRRHKVQGVFRYTATKDRGAVLSGLIGQFVERVLDGSSAPFLAYLSTNDELTQGQADQLDAIVQELERDEKGQGND